MISIGQEYKERYEDGQRELAALREELATANDENQQMATVLEYKERRLTAAEQRNESLADIADELLTAYETTIHSSYCQVNPDNDLIDRAMSTLKPTESGASE